MLKIDFIVAGAAKSGTTSIFQYLNSHPDIFIPDVKECRYFSKLNKDFKGLGAEFFANEGITDDDEYQSLFQNHQDKKCGDISNDYLYYHKESIANIKKTVGDSVKIIIILRNPIERAFSNYMHHIRDGWENLSFKDALIREDERIKDNWGWSYHYKSVGLYSEQVKDYLKNFENVKICLFEDLRNRHVFIKDICHFIGIDEDEVDLDMKEFNRSGRPKSKAVMRFSEGKGFLASIIKPFIRLFLPKNIRENIAGKIKDVNLSKEYISLEDKTFLIDFYREDIKNLEGVIKRDLSAWLKE
ncbi:sulfotransferase family protein [Gallaecimonas mangrovi]|uniref:sulfotransferase family protein n=1 Tax=Gallaecimonas mangrovi TaxID=2291597 RepID=UPI000E207FAC|nr:sulfotransferase [Gallaecimonas mangrovi]